MHPTPISRKMPRNLTQKYQDSYTPDTTMASRQQVNSRIRINGNLYVPGSSRASSIIEISDDDDDDELSVPGPSRVNLTIETSDDDDDDDSELSVPGPSRVNSVNEINFGVNYDPDFMLKELFCGQYVYCNRRPSLGVEWTLATVSLFSNNNIMVSFKDSYKKIVTSRQIALFSPAHNFTIGTRVVAMSSALNKTFCAGVVAEYPSTFNNNRYLIFFDYNYAEYVMPSYMKIMYRQSENVYEDVLTKSTQYKKFLYNYFKNYPYCNMFLLNIGDTVKVLVGSRCITAVVNKLVGSLAKISYSIDGMNTESRYIYKGSYQIRMINGNVVKHEP